MIALFNLKRDSLFSAKRCTQLCLVLFATFHIAHAYSAEGLSPFEATYEVGNNLINAGSATLSLQRTGGDNWSYRLKTTPTGVFKLTGKGNIEEISTLRLNNQNNALQVEPLTYSYRQDQESSRSVDANFNWVSKELSFLKQGSQVTESFSTPVLDRLSVTLAVMDALKSGNLQQKEMQVFDNGRVKAVAFVNEGNEIVNTKMGEMDTIRVLSNNVESDLRKTYTWFAPELGYVPVKIEQHKRGKLVARLTLVRLHNNIVTTDRQASD